MERQLKNMCMLGKAVYLSIGNVGTVSSGPVSIGVTLNETTLNDTLRWMSVGNSKYIWGKQAKITTDGALQVFLPTIICEADENGKVTVKAI